ncbi:hypothetical protein GGX14DRAFT_391655 [Mycena pura]|uniref:Uncharacterized protein n=1 Tax=Mycena pura TaxID=153505 RepID=A0AAD6VU16_9AGAR|nr:hypothetical protein GGX14DRAFT_391655 [Mycena pura]
MPNAMWPFFNKREGQDKAAMFNSGHKNTWCQAELDEYVTDHPIDKTGLDDAAFLRVHAERDGGLLLVKKEFDFTEPPSCNNSGPLSALWFSVPRFGVAALWRC